MEASPGRGADRIVGVVIVTSGAETRYQVAVRNQRLCLCLAVYDREVTGLTGMGKDCLSEAYPLVF
jgi:hypothetical protein